METRTILYNSPEYHRMLDLRHEVLRKPLGLEFSEADIRSESNDIFCVYKEADKIIGCCVLTPIDKLNIKLRQMAVSPQYKRMGIGKMVLEFAEKTATENGFTHIILNARQVAKEFYLTFGYKIISDTFIEVGIPHVKMRKEI